MITVLLVLASYTLVCKVFVARVFDPQTDRSNG